MNAQFLILLLTVYCVVTYKCNGGKDHTDTYKTEHKRDLFLDYSYGGDYFDTCARYTRRDQLLKKLPSCYGKFCVDSKYSKEGDRSSGYHIDHIVDTVHCYPDINQSCHTDIMGNVILAYYKWNREIGQKNHEINVEEKSAVYGKIYLRAKRAVLECCGIPNKSSFNEIIIISCFSSFIAISAVVVAIVIWRIKRKPQFVV